MKNKYIALTLIAIGVLGLIILALYNNLEQQQKYAERLAEINAQKTLNLNPNSIQIISVENPYSNNPNINVCSNPQLDNSWLWWGHGIVDFSQINENDISISGMGVSTPPSIPLLDWLSYPFNVNAVLYVDGVPVQSQVLQSADLYKTHKNCDTCAVQVGNNKFTFSFSGVSLSLTKSHVLKASFSLENSYAHITSSKVDVTYSMPKLC